MYLYYILTVKGVVMIATYKNFLVRYKDFNSITNRKNYWQVIVIQVLLCVVYLLGASLILVLKSQMLAGLYIVLGIILFFGFALPFIALVSRRLIDAGFSPWLIGLIIIPYLGPIALFILNQWPTKERQEETSCD